MNSASLTAQLPNVLKKKVKSKKSKARLDKKSVLCSLLHEVASAEQGFVDHDPVDNDLEPKNIENRKKNVSLLVVIAL
jgi:hypothetical protein